MTRSQKRRLYNAAARYAKEIAYSIEFTMVYSTSNLAYVGATALCPCGNKETIYTKAIRENAKLKLALHHGWHIACYHKGIDDETPCKESKLFQAAKRINFTHIPTLKM